jgi:DNA end-binding protein Ku
MSRVGLGQVTIAGREWLVAVAPLEDGLVMEMLRYPDELRKPEDFFDEVPTTRPQKEMLDLAAQLINQKTAPFKPEKFQNHYQLASRELVEAKRKGKKIISAPEAVRSGGNVVDLMEALRRSVDAKSKAKPKAKTGKKSA